QRKVRGGRKIFRWTIFLMCRTSSDLWGPGFPQRPACIQRRSRPRPNYCRPSHPRLTDAGIALPAARQAPAKTTPSSCHRFRHPGSVGNISTPRRRPGGRRPPDVICQTRTPPPQEPAATAPNGRSWNGTSGLPRAEAMAGQSLSGRVVAASPRSPRRCTAAPAASKIVVRFSGHGEEGQEEPCRAGTWSQALEGHQPCGAQRDRPSSDSGSLGEEKTSVSTVTGHMANNPEPYGPQSPPRKWVVSKTGYFWQERLPAKPAPDAARAPAADWALLDHLIRPGQQRRWDGQPERLRGLEVDDQFELRGLLDGEVAWFGALENPVHVEGGAPGQLP